jgi:outer membrane protein OmpA-like peptidoglycan-associated protein
MFGRWGLSQKVASFTLIAVSSAVVSFAPSALAQTEPTPTTAEAAAQAAQTAQEEALAEIKCRQEAEGPECIAVADGAETLPCDEAVRLPNGSCPPVLKDLLQEAILSGLEIPKSLSVRRSSPTLSDAIRADPTLRAKVRFMTLKQFREAVILGRFASKAVTAPQPQASTPTNAAAIQRGPKTAPASTPPAVIKPVRPPVTDACDPNATSSGAFSANLCLTFANGSSELSPASRSILDNQAKIYAGRSGVLKISGHANRTGPEAVNIALSKARAEAAAAYLRGKPGMDAITFETTGKGSAEPLANTDPIDGVNRRTQLDTFEKNK